MKAANKTQFSNKFASVLTKFKDSSTVQVGHDQVRSMLGEFALRDIFVAFVSKMDNMEQMNEREKKEISKVYISFVDVYKFQLLEDHYYEKFLESASKKTVGLSEVIAHICKSLLGRIQNQEQLLPFVTIIINIFHNHGEVAKILKQVSETISPNIISSLQYEIIAILQEKIGSAKVKSEFLDALLSLVLCLEEKLEVESNVVALLLKYLRHEEWSCRKNCVDIAYALLVINQSISQSIHSIVKQLKYDKIKHVRDSVNNYEKLHEQIFGKEVKEQMVRSQIPTIRPAKIKSEYSNKKVNKSPIPPPEAQRDKSNSLDKTAKLKQKNENFFKNAKNSDVIRTNEDQLQKQEQEQQSSKISRQQRMNLGEGKNFQAYLKNRVSPVRQKQAIFEKTPLPQVSEVKKALSKFQSMKSNSNKFNYENEFQHFKKKSRVQVESIKNEDSKENISFGDVEIIEKNQPEFSLSYISNKNELNHFEQFKTLLLAFEKRISDRLDRMEARISQLQKQKYQPSPSHSHFNNSKTFQVMQASQIHESPRSMFAGQTPNQSKYSYSQRQAIQSNLEDKIRGSIANENWDQAFTIALTNNKKNILLNLLQRCVFPTDKTVEECALLEVRRLLGYMSTLKWLKYFLMEREMSRDRMLKLKQDLERRAPTDNRNYEMMRQILLNEIQEKVAR